MATYRFATLDPRNVPAATETNEKVFSRDCGICLHSSGQLDGETCRYCGGTGRVSLPVLGIEVTVPALAARCSLGNIDPQHSGGDTSRAAIEDAMRCELPPEPHAKFTVCQFTTGYCDLKAVVGELATLEPGWGGSPTIIGSPQGQGSSLSVEEVAEVVARYLK